MSSLAKTYISQAANASSFEFLIVQLVNGDFQVSGGLKFHESSAVNEDLALNSSMSLTLCHRGRGQLRNRRRQAQSDVQNL